jgi:hypothetical protein
MVRCVLRCLAVTLILTGCRDQPNPASSTTTQNSIEKGEQDVYKGPLVIKVGGKYGYVDRAGKIIANPQFDSAQEFSDGLGLVCLGKCRFFTENTTPNESKHGYVDDAGKYVINPQFDNAYPFSEGLAPVCVGACGYSDEASHTWGYINKEGTIVIPLQFGDANSFSEGLAAVCVGKCVNGGTAKWEGKWGFIGKDGKFVISPQFDNAYRFEAGIAKVSIGTGDSEKTGYIDRTGKFMWNPTN